MYYDIADAARDLRGGSSQAGRYMARHRSGQGAGAALILIAVGTVYLAVSADAQDQVNPNERWWPR